MAYDSQRILERALAGREKMVEDYTGGLTALALENKRRGEHLQDVVGERQFVTHRDEEQSRRLEDRLRRQRILELNTRGFDLPENATNAQIAKAEKEHLKSRANAVVSSFMREKELNDDEYGKTYHDYLAITVDAASIEQKRQALQVMLASAEANKVLNDYPAEKKKLRAALTSGDPQKAVEEVAAKVGGDYWLYPGKNPAMAQTLIDAFHTPLSTSIDQTKQLKAQALGKRLQDIESIGREVQKNLFQSVREGGEFIDESLKTKALSPSPKSPVVAPPADPNEVMKNTPMPPAPAVAAPDTMVSDTFAKRGAVGVVADKMAGMSPTEKALSVAMPQSALYSAMFPETSAAVRSKLSNAAGGLAELPGLAKRALVGPSGTSAAAPTAAELQKFLISLPPRAKNQLRQTAASIGASPELINSNTNLVETGNISDPNVQKAVVDTMKVYRIISAPDNPVTNQFGPPGAGNYSIDYSGQ